MIRPPLDVAPSDARLIWVNQAQWIGAQTLPNQQLLTNYLLWDEKTNIPYFINYARSVIWPRADTDHSGAGY
ncbi:hypothetical protein SAMN05421740_101472 [Parapedobacter koreensis]|uniref:Uncharacterized protein n=1 Tax=Parapedobacter koreensis TaxID=332977 RepID=A0A1H7FVF7_9SPHI|nr:hypothetical protein SAMN05421740_101472 [Parapedobacter koreensis]